MIPFSDAVDRISRCGAPLLCIDACTLLDILRGPMRRSFGTEDAKSVRYFLDLAEEKPKRLTLLVAEQVDRELNDHIDEIQTEGKRAITQLDENIEIAMGTLAAFGITLPDAEWRFSPFNYDQQMRAVVDRIRTCALVVEAPTGTNDRAIYRIVNHLAPAQRGKEAKDCVIIETYLQVIEAARCRGFDERVCFISSNTKDYADDRARLPRDNLAEEFKALSVYYATRFATARFGAFDNS